MRGIKVQEMEDRTYHRPSRMRTRQNRQTGRIQTEVSLMLPEANRGRGGTAGLAYAKFIHVGGHSDKSSAKLSSRQRRQAGSCM